MNTLSKFGTLIVLTVFTFLPGAGAQQPSEKELKQAFAPKGTHRAPFKKVNEVALTSVNLQFKLATRQEQEKRNVGNIVTWGFLEGIDDALLQEIADEYYKNLAAKFVANGFSLSEAYKDHKSYQKLVENNAENKRETQKKNWGVSKIFTANNAPYIEYPTGLMGAHASLGNDLKMPVGMVFVTVDFLDIMQNISQGVSSFTLMGRSDRTDKFETDARPVIRIEGITATSIGKAFKGDGTYAKFTGGNWSYCNASFHNGFTLTSDVKYANDIESAKGIPEKFQNRFASDVVSILSMGRARGGGKGDLEATYNILADPQAYKKAVLDALDKYNDYLLAYIRVNN
ncbi:MAG: hypothetical protein QM594_13940 [Niabella sp.]